MKARATAPQTAYHKSRPRGSNFHRSQTIHDPGERPDIYRPNALHIVDAGQDGLLKCWITDEGAPVKLKAYHYLAMERIAKNVDPDKPWLDDITHMAAKAHMSRQTFLNVAHDLECLYVIRIERRVSRHGNLINVYVPLPHPLWDQFRVRIHARKPKSKSCHISQTTSLESVGKSVIRIPEEQRSDKKPEPVKAEKDPVTDLTGATPATEAETRATVSLAWRVGAWKIADFPLDMQPAMAQFMFMLTMARGWSLAHFCAWLAARHSLAKFRNPFAGLRYCARLYARTYPPPDPAPNRLELAISRYAPVTFTDGDPPPRPPRADSYEPELPAKDLVRADKILGRSPSGVVVPPQRPRPPDRSEAILAEYDIGESEIKDWLWNVKGVRAEWPLSESQLRRYAVEYLAYRRGGA
jgi:hypothetical protein